MGDFLINYWWTILIAVAAIVVIIVGIYLFVKQPRKEQINKIKEWLLFAVAKAEKELGGGTGEIKLRYVYDMFISKFPHLSSIVSFDAFSFLVDEVLEQFRNLLKTNESIELYINSIESKK